MSCLRCGGFCSLIAWVTCSWRSRWYMLGSSHLKVRMPLAMTSYRLNVISWIFSWKLLSVAQEVRKSVLLSCCRGIHATVLLLCWWCRMPSVLFLSRWILLYRCMMRILSYGHSFLSHRCGILAVALWSIRTDSMILNK